MEKIIDGLLYQQLRPGVYIYYQNGEERVRAWYTGEIIAARRKELKLTQRQLADAVNLNRSTLSRYESGESAKYCRALRKAAFYGLFLLFSAVQSQIFLFFRVIFVSRRPALVAIKLL